MSFGFRAGYTNSADVARSRTMPREIVMSQVIRYKVKPEHAAENERLIRDVFDELQQVSPAGFTYQSFVQDDGVSFIHVVDNQTGGDTSPLAGLDAFGRFQDGLGDRCEVSPVRVGMRQVGSYTDQDGRRQ
jgi:hypothetical protein